MPGPDEATELGGLARSIDALFSSAPAPEAPASGASSEETELLSPQSEEGLPEDAPSTADDLAAIATEVGQVARDLDSIEAALSEPGSAPMDTGPAGVEALEDTKSQPSWTEETLLDVPTESPDDESLFEVAQPEVAEVAIETPVPEVPGEAASVPPVPNLATEVPYETSLPELPDEVAFEPPMEAAGPGSEELQAAVDDYLGGAPEAAGTIASLAAPLLEDFALDPLADAAERLVAAAGDDPDPEIISVAESVMNPAVASKLVQRMGAERDPDRRAQYIEWCRRLGRIMAIAIRGAMTDATDRSARRAYYDALIAMGSASRPIIEGMVDDDNRFLVRNAVAILGEIGGDRAVELVTSALANTDARVRREALLSLARLKAEDADQIIVAMLDDSDASVRAAAAMAAGELKMERALRHICAMLEGQEDPEECIPLLRALGQLGDPGAVPTIEKYAVGKIFKKPRTDVRIAAYQALHHMGTPYANRLLDRAREDKDEQVRSAVTELLDSA